MLSEDSQRLKEQRGYEMLQITNVQRQKEIEQSDRIQEYIDRLLYEDATPSVDEQTKKGEEDGFCTQPKGSQEAAGPPKWRTRWCGCALTSCFIQRFPLNEHGRFKEAVPQGKSRLRDELGTEAGGRSHKATPKSVEFMRWNHFASFKE